VIAGRGMAVGDLFNDGKLDAVINVMDGHPVLLRNVNPDHNHWLELKLVGGPKSPRDAVGATVYVTANGMKQRGDVISGGSYLSTNDPRPHFGLGQAMKSPVEVHFIETFTGPAARSSTSRVPNEEAEIVRRLDRIVTITEGTVPGKYRGCWSTWIWRASIPHRSASISPFPARCYRRSTTTPRLAI
jgi:hypothetical protein